MSNLQKNREYLSDINRTINKVNEEIEAGLLLLNKIDKPIVAFFGSSKVNPENSYYQEAQETASRLGRNGYAILSGGGPGIMHAANSGAIMAKAPSLGLKADLLTKEKVTDNIFTHELSFHFLFVRRFLMAIKSEALIFYPGGYGTLNELFEYAVLMQTGIVDAVPLICVNKKYWQGLFDWIKEKPAKEGLLTNGLQDIDLLHFVDSITDIEVLLKGGRLP